MRSIANKLAPTLGRFFMMTIISLTLIFGVSGFIPLSDKTSVSQYQNNDMMFPDELNGFLSHNLIISTDELRCLSLNIYFEARSESLQGKLAVAGVTMNRVKDEKFPDTICGVVKQGNEARLHRCQFSWWCDGKADRPEEKIAWRAAQQLARLYLIGHYSDPTGNALWYHADYVSPGWAEKMSKTAKIGRHIFYKAKETRDSQIS